MLQRSLCIFLTLLLLACGKSARTPSSEKPRVLVTLQPLAWIVDELAGAAFDVDVLVPPGSNPHSFEPTLSQARLASRASLCVKVGHPDLGFESTFLADVASANRGLRIVNASAGLPLQDEDPHVWTAPSAVRVMGGSIAAALMDVAPAEKPAIEARLIALNQKVDETDLRIRAELEGLEGRSFLVFHPSWGYFAREYGLIQVAIETEGKEPGIAAIQALLGREKARGTRVLFVEPSFAPSSAETVARELGARLVTVDPLSRRWPSALAQMASELKRTYAE